MSPETELELRLLQAAADPTRLAILRQLSADGPTCACDLTDCCAELSQSTVSHHLRVLREAGWIEGQRRGTWIWYAVRAEAVERFAAIADGIRPGRPRPATAFGARAATLPRPAPADRPAWRQW